MRVAKHCIISGRVQGVYFRQGTQLEAQKHKVTGWVKNLPSGQVECQLFGERAAVEAVCQWLHKGPLVAKVKAVEIKDIPWQEYAAFDIHG